MKLTNRMGEWELINIKGIPVHNRESFVVDDEVFVITGGRPPHHHGSTGRVYMESVNNPTIKPEWFPTVIRCTWVLKKEAQS